MYVFASFVVYRNVHYTSDGCNYLVESSLYYFYFYFISFFFWLGWFIGASTRKQTNVIMLLNHVESGRVQFIQRHVSL